MCKRYEQIKESCKNKIFCGKHVVNHLKMSRMHFEKVIKKVKKSRKKSKKSRRKSNKKVKKEHEKNQKSKSHHRNQKSLVHLFEVIYPLVKM